MIKQLGASKVVYLAPESEALDVVNVGVICASDGTEYVNENEGIW